MRKSKILIGLGVILALVCGVCLASAEQGGNCTIGGDTGPGVRVQLAAEQGKAAPPQPQNKPGEADKGQRAADKKQEQGKAPQTAAPKPAGAPAVPAIPPDEGC